MADNSIVMMRGKISKFILFFVLFFSAASCHAMEKIGVLTDTLLTPVNYYNAYYKTPEFFAQDIRGQLSKRGVTVITPDKVAQALLDARITQKDLESLASLQQGYNIEYQTLRKIAKKLGVSKFVIVTMGMDTQRDFLKNTFWNIANVPGQDVVNPTHRVSVYTALVDVNKEFVMWESIYAKNIRNNKMKNLDTTISSNYEGMLRLKEYSKYISPDIAYNVKMKMLNVDYVEPPTAITKENVKQYVKDRHNIGVKKELSEIDRQKWDTEKFVADSKVNTRNTAIKIKNGTVKGAKAVESGTKKVLNKTTNGLKNLKGKIFKSKKIQSL